MNTPLHDREYYTVKEALAELQATICPVARCGMPIFSPAEAWLHKKIHEAPASSILHFVPCRFWPAIAVLMQEYADAKKEAKTG